MLDLKLSKYRNIVYHARNQSDVNAKPSEMLFDPNTGQAYFKPRVGRPPKTMHNGFQDPIAASEKLYR
jgi:hypothetical protein